MLFNGQSHLRHMIEINSKYYAYSYGPAKDDRMRHRLIKAFDVFDDVKMMSDKDVALLARQDEIDIAIDLNGYTKNSRSGIFAYRAAPIQINYLGYPGTMGANLLIILLLIKSLFQSD